MTNAVQIINDEIQSLVAELASTDRELDGMRKRILAFEAKKVATNEKIALLRGVAKKIRSATTNDDGDVDDKPNGSHYPATDAIGEVLKGMVAEAAELVTFTRGGTTKAVMEVLQSAGRAMKGSEVADLLDGKLETKSSDPKRLIQNTLINLRNRGVLKQGNDGRYELPTYIPAPSGHGKFLIQTRPDPQPEKRNQPGQ